jgi:hypothetical protein
MAVALCRHTPVPYRQHRSILERSLELRLLPEVWGSVIGATVVTFLAGLSLCVTTEQTLGLATGTVLLLGTLIVAPLSAVATANRPKRLEVSAGSLRLVYPDAQDRCIDRRELFVHRVARGRVALDREATMTIYVDELRREVRAEVVELLCELAGYDVLAPEAELLRLASRGGAGLRFHVSVDISFLRRAVFCALVALGAFGFLTDLGWWSVAIMGAAGLLLVVLESAAGSSVAIQGGELIVSGFFGPRIAFHLDTLSVAPTKLPRGLMLNGGATLHRILFTRRDWEALVAVLSRTLGYDVTEPATEAARLAKLTRRAA